MLVVGAFFAIGGGQELAADNNADATIRDGIIHSANGGNFADFHKQMQMRLFSALDNALSQKARETLNEFAAVKKADVQLQTQLGNRKGQVAANIIGAFADSPSSAFGWQLRVYGGENDSRGANAGIFFRRLDGESLYGVNSFIDYENGDYGEFLRYGIGGELQNRFAAFAINYYLPITDDKFNGNTVAFSREGYDANLRINIPRLDFLKVRADYYHYDGKYSLAEDNGLRYGMEVQPLDNLHIGVFYDDGGEKFGGDIVYAYNFAPPPKRQSKADFSPDLFAPVLREYSQRIVVATVGTFPFRYQQIGGANRGAFTIGIMGVVGTVAIEGGSLAIGSLSSGGFSVQDNTILLYLPTSQGITAAILTINTPAQTIILTLAITARNAPAFNRINNAPFTVGIPGTVGFIVLPNGAINGALTGGFSVVNSAIVFSANVAAVITGGITITNAFQSTTLSLVITSANAPAFDRINNAIFTVGIQGTVGTVILPNGAFDNGKTIFLFSANIAGTTATILIITSALQRTTLSIRITAQNAPPLNIALVGGRVFAVSTQNTLPIAVSGGYLSVGGTYSITVQGAGVSITAAMLLFSASIPTTAIITIIADDDLVQTAPASLAITLMALTMVLPPPPLSAVLSIDVAIFSVSVLGTIGTIHASGGVPSYAYNILQQGAAFDLINNIVRFTSAIPTTLTATISVADTASPPSMLSLFITATATAAPPPIMSDNDVMGQFSGYYSRVFVLDFPGTVGTVSASGGSGSGYQYSVLSGNGFTIQSDGEVRFSAAAAVVATATISADDDNPANAPGTIVLMVTAISGCDFITCTALGHRRVNRSNLPTLSLATILYRAGANTHTGESPGNRLVVNIIGYFAANDGVAAQPVMQFLLDNGADITTKIAFPGFGNINALEYFNINSSGPNGLWLSQRGARCDRYCRAGQTDVDGQMCNRNTGVRGAGAAAGADCTMRIANVQFTAQLDASGQTYILKSESRVQITVPAVITERPIVRILTANFHALSITATVIAGDALIGLAWVFFNETKTWTITVVEGSEEYITTGSVNGVNMPPSFPPSFPQMPKLALAKNPKNALSFPPHYGFMRRQKEMATKPPPPFL